MLNFALKIQMVKMAILEDIYERITLLRAHGVRMKDMAAAAGWPSSVFSALYSSVLPAYRTDMAKGLAPEVAINRALAYVNNVSKKRLLSDAVPLRDALMRIELPEPQTPDSPLPFQQPLADACRRTVQSIGEYAGSYLSYSMASSHPALKVEPYRIVPDRDGRFVRVDHRSVYDTEHSGFALLDKPRHLYLTFNERTMPELAFFTIYLQTPLYDHPTFLKGLYLSFDYNHNPIARRIVFVKQSADTDTFRQLKARVVEEGELTPQERYYFDYTCQRNDALRTCTVPTPRLDEHDLIAEKQILDI